MATKLLSIAILVLSATAASGQIPSKRYSPLNYFGRHNGFGFSEGYHSRVVSRPIPVVVIPFQSLSTIYSEPSTTQAFATPLEQSRIVNRAFPSMAKSENSAPALESKASVVPATSKTDVTPNTLLRSRPPVSRVNLKSGSK